MISDKIDGLQWDCEEIFKYFKILWFNTQDLLHFKILFHVTYCITWHVLEKKYNWYKNGGFLKWRILWTSGKYLEYTILKSYYILIWIHCKQSVLSTEN